MIFVVATRHSYDSFFSDTLFGKWLKAFGTDKIMLLVYPDNSHGLSTIYNDALSKTSEYDIINFVHDDVFILDIHWQDLIYKSHEFYDVTGVAGGRNLNQSQPAWCVTSIDLKWDDPSNLCGSIYHGDSLDNAILTTFGNYSGPLRAIDGVFISVKREVIVRTGIKFDTTFKFNMYDTDFCRQLNKKNIHIGLCPLSLLHASTGKVNESYIKDFRMYQKKWESLDTLV